jgi:hypothetical protein
LSAYFTELAGMVESAVPMEASAAINMAKWFDIAGIDLHKDDELTRSAYGVARLFNAYVHRMSQR